MLTDVDGERRSSPVIGRKPRPVSIGEKPLVLLQVVRQEQEHREHRDARDADGQVGAAAGAVER